MKTSIFFLSFFIFMNTNAQERSLKLANFSHIKTYDGISLTLIKAEENKALVSGQGGEEVSFEVANETLKVKMNIENIWDESKTEIKVFYKQLKALEANQDTHITVQDSLKQDELNLEAQSGSSILARVHLENLFVKSHTGGQIELSGNTQYQEVNINTGGQYYAKNLTSKNTEIQIYAGGVADITTQQKLTAKVRAGGTVNEYGNPEVIDKNTLFGGKVVQKN